MTIKKTLFLLWVALMGSSFSAHAVLYKMTGGNSAAHVSASGLSAGTIVDSSYIYALEFMTWGRNYKSCRPAGGTVLCRDPVSHSDYPVSRYVGVYNCPTGQEIIDGKCQVPPIICADKKGEDAPSINTAPPGPFQKDVQYCDTATMCEAQRSYYAAGGSMYKDFFYTGNDCVGSQEDYAECPWYGACGEKAPEPEPAFDGCEKPYADQDWICRQDVDGDGMPNVDAPFDVRAVCGHDSGGKFYCKGGSFTDNPDPTDPTKDITDPSGGSAIVDPNTPPIDVEAEPEVEEPTPAPDGSNSDIVQAITNQNRDFNRMVHTLNVDNNANFANVNRNLDMLNQRQDNTHTAIVESMKQDIEIYNNNKAMQRQLQSELLGSINSASESQVASTSLLGQKVVATGDKVIAAIDKGAFLNSLAVEQSGDKVTEAVNKLADKLGGEACVPTAENKYCENPHGLSSGYASDAYTQMLDVAGGQLSAANSTLLSHVNNAVQKPMTDEVQGYLDRSVSDLLDVMPSYQECQDLVLQTVLGSFSLGCEFSKRLKSILAFVIYIYTLMTLSDILFNGVTPVAGTTPYISRR